MEDSKDAKHRAPRGHKAPRGIVTAIVLVALLIILDVALCFVFEPYGSHSELVWTEYRQTKDVDTIFVGTSVTADGLNPESFNEEMGSFAYSMSCPGQPLHESLTAIKTAAQEHELKRVVMLIGYDTMVIEPMFDHALSYIQAKCVGEPITQAIADVVDLFSYDYYFKRNYSVLGMFPWAYSHIHLSPSNVRDNVYNRLHYDVFEGGRRFVQNNDPNWEYHGLGYGSYNNTLSPNSTHSDVPKEEKATFCDENIKALRNLCAYCRDNGIELYVFGAPYAAHEVLAYGDAYAEGMRSLQSLVTEEGAHYFDLNMARRDLFDPDLSYFCDSEHLNHKGATAAGKATAQVVMRVEAGEDASGLFFDYSEEGQRAWLESIDYVDSVDYTWEMDGSDGIRVEAHAVTGPSTPVEYRMELLGASGEWGEVRGWDVSPIFQLKDDGSGSQKIRVYARSTNGRQDKDRRVEGTVAFA